MAARTQTPQLENATQVAATDVSAGPDLRRITEHDRDYQRLHRQTVARLNASILALVRTLRHSQRDRSADPAQALSAFAQRQGAILRRAYEDAWREGVRDYWQATSLRRPHKHLPVAPSEATLAKHLAFYAPSVGKMAQEALTAAYAISQVLAEPSITLAGKDDPLSQWQAGVQQRVELQAHLTWTGLQDGYAAAGAADPASPYAVLYWTLGPVKTHHCGDCPLIAAGSPYDRPGTPGGHELNQTPGDGRTECGAACHCSLDYGMAPTAQQAQSIWQDAQAVPPPPPGSLKWPDVPQPTAAEVDAAQKQLLDDYRTQFERWETVRGTLPSLPDLFGTTAEGAAQWAMTWDALTPVQQSVLADVFRVLAKVDATFGYPSLEEAAAAAELSQQDLADLQAKMQGMVDHLDDFQQQLAQATEADWLTWFGKGPVASFFWSLRQDFYDVLEWLISRTEPPIPPDQLSESERGMVLYNPYHYPAGGPQGGQFAPRGGGGGGGEELGSSHTGGQHEAQGGGLHAAYGTHARGAGGGGGGAGAKIAGATPTRHGHELDGNAKVVGEIAASGHKVEAALMYGAHDTWCEAIMREQGMAGLPDRVNVSQLDALKAQGDVELWRGFHDQKHAQDFLGGDIYAAHGVSGSGYYVAHNETGQGKSTAEDFKSYYDRGRQNITLHMTLKGDARVIDYETLREKMWLNDVEHAWGQREQAVMRGDHAGAKRWQTYEDLTFDMGRYAALKGYDAIKIKEANLPEYLVVNRSALRVLVNDQGDPAP